MRRLGKTDVLIPRLGQGTWQMGIDPRRRTQEVEALRTGIELGMTLIDTAEMYADGEAERIVAEATRDCRDEVFLVSKVVPSNATYAGVIEAAKRSLERLKTDRIDLYLLHWPSQTVPIDETMRAFEQLADEGLIRFIGISNFDRRETPKVEAALERHPLVCNQVLYHLLERGIECTLLPYAHQQDITVMAYSPFGQGEFPSAETEQGKLLVDIGREYGKTPYQVALNFLITHGDVVAIPKASQTNHVRDNAASLGWELASEHMQAIHEAFPVPEGDPPLAWL